MGDFEDFFDKVGFFKELREVVGIFLHGEKEDVGDFLVKDVVEGVDFEVVQ